MISLLIPTMNRSEFVIRLLKYYANFNFNYSIFIGDSSSQEEFEKTSLAINSLKGRLKVEHFHYPNTNNYAVTEQLIQNVTTPYASFLPDDDFYVPESIEKCIDFLERNPDYSCSWGKTIMFNLENSGAYGQFHALSRANPDLDNSVEGSCVEERLRLFAKNYAPVFIGVCRTAMFKKALRNSSAMSNSIETKDIRWGAATAFGELKTAFSMVVQGKGKSLDCVYWIRQDHDRRYIFPKVLDWITCANWIFCYEIVSRQVIGDIMGKEDLCGGKAEEIWKEAFQTYIGQGLYHSLKGRYAPSNKKRIQDQLKNKVKQMPGLYFVLKSLRNGLRLVKFKLGKSEEVSLCTVLNSSSYYHKDFMPIYNLVSNGQSSKI